MELKLYPPWKNAVKTFIETGMSEPGSMITEEWKLEHFGINKPGFGTVAEVKEFQLKVLSAFESFREELLTEYQVHMKPCGKGGHIVIPANEQTREAWTDGVGDIKRAMQKLKTRLEHVNHTLLTSDERRENVEAQTRYAMFSSMFRKARNVEISKADEIA